MPPEAAQDMLFEAQGLKYDEYEMAFFNAKLSYHSTITERMASRDNHLPSLSAAQAKILRMWEMLNQRKKELSEQGVDLPLPEKRQLAQYEWRFKQLEKTAVEHTTR
ncbi:hypothetical protein F1880_007599 [Penicillium rolfsii]|nr:hypothetical protein F1880_007599 [Penicillium rolfsii]